ncbi:MAG: polysaccharide deacetylase family protein [Armatimonadota bacterium]
MTGIKTIIQPYAALGLPARTVMLTFDDGPNAHDDITARLLDVLQRHGVTACFCVPGVQAARHPALVRRIFADGHLIVNHSHTHPATLPLLRSTAAVVADILRGDHAIGEALGISDYRSRYYRPSGGVITGAMSAALDRLGMCLLPVTFITLDIFCGPVLAPRLLPYLLQRIQRDGGGMPVIHDRLAEYPLPSWLAGCRWYNGNRNWVPAVVDEMIMDLKRDGFTLGVDSLRH